MLTNADISVLQDFKIRTFAEEPAADPFLFGRYNN